MGAINVKHTGSGAAIALSSDGTSLLLDGTAIGGGADLYAANESSPAAQPSATGANAIAIGDSAVAAGSYSASLGYKANANGNRSIALGYAYTNGADAATISTGTNSSSYGALASRAVAIGWRSKAAFSDSFAIGDTATTSATNQIALGGTADTVKISGTYTLPIADGTANQVLTTDGSGAVTFATAGGGDPALYRDNASGATTPSATGTNAVAIGTNAIASNTESVALGGDSLSSGYKSFAAVIGNNYVAYGASAWAAISIGLQSRATASDSIALGSSAYSSGSSGLALGGSSTASGTSSIAIGNSGAEAYAATSLGQYALSSSQGKYSYASGRFGSTEGSAQTGTYVLRADTTDATPEGLTTRNNGGVQSDNQVNLPNNSVYGFTGIIIAREDSAATNDFAVWEVKGGAVRAASASTTALGSYNINKISESTGAANWSIAISADTTNGAIAFTVTGEASHSIRWVATINTTEVIY